MRVPQFWPSIGRFPGLFFKWRKQMIFWKSSPEGFSSHTISKGSNPVDFLLSWILLPLPCKCLEAWRGMHARIWAERDAFRVDTTFHDYKELIYAPFLTCFLTCWVVDNQSLFSETLLAFEKKIIPQPQSLQHLLSLNSSPRNLHIIVIIQKLSEFADLWHREVEEIGKHIRR